MCVAVAAVFAWAIAPPAAVADDVAAYLERHGLHELLALHLEERIERADPPERGELAIRLAAILASLLETTTDPAARVSLETRSRDLLAIMPPDQADELRFSLLRARYSRVEKIAEDHRLRLADGENVEQAKADLAGLAPELATLRRGFSQRLDVAKRRFERSSPLAEESAALAREVDRLERLYRKCLFLTAWVNYYLAWLGQTPDAARAAEQMFGEILDPDVERLRLEDVSIDLLENEAYARSALGMALCKSITSRVEDAIRWAEVLESEKVFEPIREQAPAWKLAILLDRGDFRWAQLVLEAARAEQPQLPLVWVRLVAVHALEAAGENAEAAELARGSIAELAARGELDQVLDLATRYGTESMGRTGFVPLYVRGAQAYREARAAHGDDRPTSRSDLASLYDRAAATLNEAIAEPDAERFPDAKAGAQLLIGWCSYFQGRFFKARDAFVEAAKALPASEAPEALWMAIVALDHVVEADGSESARADLQNLIDLFLDRFPSSARAPRLILRRAEDGDLEASPEIVAQLLSIPPTSESYDLTRRRAARMLYQLYRESAGRAQIEYGEQYLSVAVPLLARPDTAALAEDERLRREFVVRARRIVEVALTPGIERLAAASQTLQRLDEVDQTTPLGLDEIADELDFRRMQMAMYQGSIDESAGFAERLWNRDNTSAWATAAVRLVFREAVETWRSSPEDQIDAALDLVVRYGGWALRDFERRGAALSEPDVMMYYATVAEASREVWRRGKNEEMGRRALFLYRQLVEANPQNAMFLRSAGILADAMGDDELALNSWRKLSAGLEVGSEPWFEAKYLQIRVLARTDPVHAREVFAQFAMLYPDFGPEPWGPRFAAMAQEFQWSVEPAQESPQSEAIDENEIEGDGS